MIASFFRYICRCVYRISSGDERALRALSAAYTSVGSPSPACRDLTLARFDALHNHGGRP